MENLNQPKKKKFVLCFEIQSDLSSTFCRQFSCVFLALLLSMLMMVFPAILPYFLSWKTAWQWQSNPLGIFGVHLDAPNWRLKRDAQWSLNLSTFLPLLHAPPPTTCSPFPSNPTDRFHFNFLPFSFLFLGCLDTNLTNAKGDAKLQEPASCQRATTLSPSSPLSSQLVARNMCAKFTLEKHLENAVACTFFGMRRSAAAEWRRGSRSGKVAH